jgi:cytochrome c biogenesis factor
MGLNEFWKSALLIVVLALSIGLFGTLYGVVLNKVNSDTYQNAVNSFNTIFIVNAVLIVLLGILALFFIKSDPSMFQPYVLVVLHLSLLMSSLSLSYSVISQTS